VPILSAEELPDAGSQRRNRAHIEPASVLLDLAPHR